MIKIWHIIGAKEYEQLSNSDKQCMVENVLHEMKIEAQQFAKTEFKKQCIEAVSNSLKSI